MLASATLSAVEDGLLTLDDSIDRWLPEFAAPRVLRTADSELADTIAAQHRLTVEDLLTMRLGTGFDYERADSPVVEAAAQAQLGWGPPVPTAVPHTPDEWVRALAALPLIEQPGQFWRYGAAYSLLGVLLARSSRQDLPQVLHERVLGPLGMHDTGFHADPSQAARLVDCLVWPGSGEPSVLDPATGSAWLQAPSFPDGAGGLLGTVDDVLTFGRALLTADAGGGSARPWLSPT